MSLLLVVGVGSAWGSTTVSMTSFSTISGLVDNDANISYEAAKGTATTAPAVNNNEIRVYQNGGTFTVTANNGVKINSVTLGSSMGTTVTYSIDGGTASSDQSITANSTITVNGLDCSTVLFTCTGTSKTTRLYVNHLSVTYSSGDVTPTVATPTFSPAAGAVSEGTNVTISCATSGAAIHYTTDGSTPTSNSAIYSSPIAINSATTIKAIGTKSGYNNSEVATASYTVQASVSGYVIDFESSLDSYTDWTFNNIGRHNSGITAHGGNYWGANVNTSNNGVSTANIQTTNKVARPGTFTCYVSKESNNTTSSTWYVQVSNDGSTWVDVTTQSATSMNKGEWVEISANLTSYTNVYVRLYYNGTNAVRTVDDITLTESSSTDPVNPTFEWSAATASAVLGSTPTLPTLNNNSDGVVTYSSSETSVATIDGEGNVTIVGAGETTITASVAATSTYNAATASYVLTVSEPTPANQLVFVDPTTGDVTFYFNESGWGIPEGSSNKRVAETEYTNSDYTITIAGSTGNGFYYNERLFLGKNGAYLTLPAFTFDVERIEIVGGDNNASTNVVQNIFVNNEPASTQTTGCANVTNSYAIADAYQAAGNVYTLKVTSNHNTQITSIKVIKKSTNPSLSFASATATVNVGGIYTQAANAYNIGEATVSYTSSNAEIATVEANGVVTGVSAGTVTITASVTVDGEEYTATYEVTVQKNTAELSFAQSVVSINENETYAGQTVTKPADILDSEITYSSNNPSVASVDASTGAITLGGALGTATITATFAGNTKYNAATATYTFKVTAASAATGDYEKVTSVNDLTDGEYLIVYETGSVAFNGGLSELDAASNYIAVTITDNKVESNETVDAAIFTIEAVDGGYTILSSSNKYIGHGKDENKLTASDSPLINSISFEENGDVNIIGSGGAYLRYNANSGQERFRYFKSSTYTNQKAIQLYKKTSSSASVAAPVITPETGTYETRPQTVSITCSTEGATIYYTTDGSTPTTSSSVYTGSFNVSKNTTIKAIAAVTIDGNTVVSRLSSSVITMKVNAPVFSPADGSSFSENYNVTISADAGLTIYYITQDNKIFKSETGKTADPSESTGELVSSAVAYSGALTFGQSMMVTAICMDSDGNLSEPVTVRYTYTGAVVPPYYSSFSASEGDFTATNETDGNTITGNGAPEWRMNSNTGADAIARWGEERYYMFVRGTSGNTVQNRTRWYGTAYFTSPIIDLTDKGNASFSFIHAAHHFYADPNESASVKDATLESTLDDNKISQACKVQVGICDESGNVSTWNDIASTDINWPEQLFDPSKSGVSADGKSTTNPSSRSGLFPRANSGDISLSGYEDQKIRIRFVYTSTPSNYGTWNIDQITVNAVNVEEMTMNSRGWTTYVFDHDIDAYTTTQNYISGGEETLQIFKVTEFDHETCVLQQLGKFEEYTTANNSERYIPAKTPVVIHGPAGATIDFVEYSAPEMLPTVKNNLLIASLSPNTAKAPVGSGIRYFVLQWNTATNQPWFNKVSEGREIPDHRAYLNGTDQMDAITTSSNPVKGIYVLGEDWEITAIDSVSEEVSGQIMNGEWYTLQGVRVDRPTERGIYILNGKKVLIK